MGRGPGLLSRLSSTDLVLERMLKLKGKIYQLCDTAEVVVASNLGKWSRQDSERRELITRTMFSIELTWEVGVPSPSLRSPQLQLEWLETQLALPSLFIGSQCVVNYYACALLTRWQVEFNSPVVEATMNLMSIDLNGHILYIRKHGALVRVQEPRYI